MRKYRQVKSNHQDLYGERSEMAKGYEFAKGKLVVFTAQELKVLEDATSPTLGIEQFVPIESVDPVYFMATYYLLPDKGGGRG